jgi:hypothetical protein
VGRGELQAEQSFLTRKVQEVKYDVDVFFSSYDETSAN